MIDKLKAEVEELNDLLDTCKKENLAFSKNIFRKELSTILRCYKEFANYVLSYEGAKGVILVDVMKEIKQYCEEREQEK
jgi:hypothetical protein